MNYDNSGVHQWHFRHDALEAFNSFSAARNLFFWITLICMLLIQGVFFSIDRGVINAALDMPEQQKKIEQTQPVQALPGETTQQDGNSHQEEINFQQQNKAKFIFCSLHTTTTDNTVTSDTEKAEPTLAPTASDIENAKSNAKLITSSLKRIIAGANVVVVFSVLMYCICLFLSIQLSLTGSLGGMANSARAFFSAFFAALLIIPWTKSISPGLPTMLFSFDQVVNSYIAKISHNYGSYGEILYYARFCGLWAIVLIFIMLSQWRSCQSVKQITQRAQEWKTKNPIEVKPSAIVETPKVEPELKNTSAGDGTIPLA